MLMANQYDLKDNKSEVKFLTPLNIEAKTKKTKCYLKTNHINYIDYKNYYILNHFLTERGEILPRRRTYTTAKQHRRLKRAIKRCRHIGLLPFTTAKCQ
ncbi:30S ribosomal protein S18 [Candidatus Karelsulcia muelleri]